MSRGTASNVELGPGLLFVAPLGTTEPTSATAALPSAWRGVGYTEEGSTLNINLTQSEVEVAEEIDPLFYVLTKRASSLTVSMAEVSGKNLALSLGGGADATLGLDQSVPVPAPGAEVAVMMAWDYLESTATNFVTANKRLLVRQAKFGGQISIPRKKAPAKALIAVTVNFEKPTGKDPITPWADSTGLF